MVFTRYAVKEDEDPGIMGKWWNDVVREGSKYSKIVASLEPAESDLVIRKPRYSAFVGTNLDQSLRERKTKGVVITGVLTHLCCETTARDAFMRDFTVHFVIDATASKDESLHLSSLRTLTDGFAVPVTTDEVIASMGGASVD